MKTVSRTLTSIQKVLALIAVVSGLAVIEHGQAAQIINYGTVTTPTTLSELDLTAEYGTFPVKVNLRESDVPSRTVGSVVFDSDYITTSFPGGTRTGGGATSYSIGSLLGSTELAEIVRRVYWGNMTYTLDVIPDRPYKLQLFMYGTARNFDIDIDARPGLEVDNLALQGSVFTVYTGWFTPTTTSLQIAFTQGGDGGDTNPIVSAITLESIPEPASLSLLALGSLLMLRRRR